jgi:hypothetical protein
MTQMSWSNLLSGLLGSIIGSVIGAAATVWATSKTIKATASQTTRLQIEQVLQQQKVVARGLAAEAAENLRSVSTTDVKNWEHKTLLIATFWDAAKSNVFWMPERVQELLREVYTGISKHNDIVLYDRHALDVGQGAVTQPVMDLKKDIALRLQKLLSALQPLQ